MDSESNSSSSWMKGALDSLSLRHAAPCIIDTVPGEEAPNSVEATPLWRSSRLVVMWCCFLSMVTNFSGQTLMGSALVCMVDSPPRLDEYPNGTSNWTSDTADWPSTEDQPPEWKFAWDSKTQGLVLSSFFIGYYVFQLPSGAFSQWTGPKKLLVSGHALAGLLQISTVPASRWNLAALLVVRILGGAAASPLFVSTMALLSNWTPRQETSLVFGAVGLGMEIGNMLSFGLSMFACQISLQGGWPFIFYCLGGLQLMTSMLITCLTTDLPSNHPFLKPDEAIYLLKTTAQQKKETPAPVWSIVTSLPVYAIIVARIGSHMAYFVFVSDGPQYMRDVIRLSSLEISVLFSVTCLAIFPTVIILGSIADRLVLKGVVSNTTVRKSMEFLCKALSSIFMVILGYLPEGTFTLTFFLNLGFMAALGLAYLGAEANSADLSDGHTGAIATFVQISSYWVSIVSVLVAGSLTQDKSRGSWQTLFYMTMGVQAFCIVFYLIFGSGEVQPWATTGKNLDEDTDAITEQEEFKGEPTKAEYKRPQDVKKTHEGRSADWSADCEGEDTPLLGGN